MNPPFRIPVIFDKRDTIFYIKKLKEKNFFFGVLSLSKKKSRKKNISISSFLILIIFSPLV